MRVEASIKSEGYRIARALSDTFSGFYISNKFLILPYSKVDFKRLPSNTVLLPDNVKEIAGVEFGAIEFPDLFGKRNSKPFFNEFLIKCEKFVESEGISEKLPQFDLKAVNEIKVKLKEICDEISQVLPSFKPDLENLLIHPTLFGTKGSFFTDTDGNIELFIRCNSGKLEIERIFFLILAIFTRTKLKEKYHAQWYDAQLVEEWFINETIVAEILKNHGLEPDKISLNRSIRQGVKSQYQELSNQFIKELGLDHSNKQWSVNENLIFYGDQKVKDLTWEESNILKNMVGQVHKVFTYDEIAKFMLFDDGTYSLYAISKRIERMRKKLQSQGISPFLIKNVRGEGFYLQNAI